MYLSCKSISNDSHLWNNLVIILLLSFITGCSSNPPVVYDKKSNFSFGTLKTYHIIFRDEEPEKYISLQGKRTVNAINTSLKQSGYQQSTLEQADFLVTFHSVVEKKFKVSSAYHNWGYRPYWRGFHYTHPTQYKEYKKGTLIIDIIDPELKEVVWRGSTSNKLQRNPSSAERITRIQLSVKQILEGFPG